MRPDEIRFLTTMSQFLAIFRTYPKIWDPEVGRMENFATGPYFSSVTVQHWHINILAK